jgi:exodeoxyribonuclease VII small subunit
MSQKKSFEQSLQELETIVGEIESGDLPLETALKKFETGVRLSAACSEKLNEAEKKISLLLKNSAGDYVETPFIPDESRNDR